jgi:hypothetical protein
VLSEHRTLDRQVVVFMGPVNMSGYEAVNRDEISYLTELSMDAGAIVGSRVNALTTLCVTSELTQPEELLSIPRNVKIMREDEFMETYLSEALTGEEWE